jgi:hypothetical protein
VVGKFMRAVWGDIAAKVRGNDAGTLIPDPQAIIAALDIEGQGQVVQEMEPGLRSSSEARAAALCWWTGWGWPRREAASSSTSLT